MSKIHKRNFVKKHMDQMHRPKTHTSKKVYDRKNKWSKDNAEVEHLPVKQKA